MIHLYFYGVLLPLVVLLGVLLILRIYLKRAVLCSTEDRLDGKTVIITGGNSGLGHATATELSKRGARVILACRNRGRRDSAPFAVRSRSGNVNVRFMYLDLSSLDSIVEFCREVLENESRIDVLINNAAVICPQEYTADQLDINMGVNFFGHFYLTVLLLDKLKSNAGATRVINLVSEAYRSGQLDLSSQDLMTKGYSMYKAYASSKLALVMMTKELKRRHGQDKVTSYAVNPGSVNTRLYRSWPGIKGNFLRFLAQVAARTPEEGCQTILHCAISKEVEKSSGMYFYDCKPSEPNLRGYDADFSRQLWDKAEEIITGKGFSLTVPEDEEDF